MRLMTADTCAVCHAPLTFVNHYPINDDLCAKCWMAKWSQQELSSEKPPSDPDAQFKWNSWAKSDDAEEK